MKSHLTAALMAGTLLVFSACKKDKDDSVAPYTVPDTYTFDNVDFTEATATVRMVVNVNGYIGTTQSNMNQVKLDQTKITNLWNNTGNAFDTAWLNTSGYNLAAKTSDAAIIKGALDALTLLSNQPLTPATTTTAGYYSRNAGKIMVSNKGIEFVQAFQKGSMGATLFSQAIQLLDKVPTSDNNTVTPGKGTEMAHNFDLAFGYLAVPLNYDTTTAFSTANKAAMPLWGGYLYERGRYIQAGYNLFKAFRTGRAAIVAKDNKVVKAQVDSIKLYWEKLAAAAAWEYSQLPKSQAGNLASQLHSLSEGCGFVAALKYRSANSPLSAAKYAELLGLFSPDSNFYDLINDPTYAKLNQAKEILKAAYGNLQAQ
jgi:hypothetical protein